MDESRITLTERLRREGRWEAASLFKDQCIRALRAEGMKRREAADKAWRRMGREFPPLPPPDDPDRDLVDQPVAEPELDDETLAKLTNEKAPDLIQDVFWVYEHLEDGSVTPLDAPGLGAWGMWCWARRQRNRFIEHLLPKAAAARRTERSADGHEEDVDPGLPELRKMVQRTVSADGVGRDADETADHDDENGGPGRARRRRNSAQGGCHDT